MQGHQNEKIYKKAFQIIENFFGQEEEDNDLLPAVNQDSQQFEFNIGQPINPPNSAAPNARGGF